MLCASSPNLRPLLFVAPFASLVLLALGAACATDSESDQVADQIRSDDVINTQFDDQPTGGAPPLYTEPIPITTGDYLPSDFPFEDVGQRAIEESKKEPTVFEGRMGGFELYSFESFFGTARDSPARSRCKIADFRNAVYMTFTYLPGGSFANSPQYEALCSDGSISFVSQEFGTKHGGYIITLRFDDKAYPHEAPAERVRQTTVRGRSVVVSDAPVPEGFGLSTFAVETSKGFILLESTNLPAEESLKIIEGLTCEDC